MRGSSMNWSRTTFTRSSSRKLRIRPGRRMIPSNAAGSAGWAEDAFGPHRPSRANRGRKRVLVGDLLRAGFRGELVCGHELVVKGFFSALEPSFQRLEASCKGLLFPALRAVVPAGAANPERPRTHSSIVCIADAPPFVGRPIPGREPRGSMIAPTWTGRAMRNSVRSDGPTTRSAPRRSPGSSIPRRCQRCGDAGDEVLQPEHRLRVGDRQAENPDQVFHQGGPVSDSLPKRPRPALFQGVGDQTPECGQPFDFGRK